MSVQRSLIVGVAVALLVVAAAAPTRADEPLFQVVPTATDPAILDTPSPTPGTRGNHLVWLAPADRRVGKLAVFLPTGGPTNLPSEFKALDLRGYLTLTASGQVNLTGPVFGATLSGRGTVTAGVLHFADLVNKRVVNLDEPWVQDAGRIPDPSPGAAPAVPGERRRYVEHFGFADGISQPTISGVSRTGRALSAAELPPGELLLGYPDVDGDTSGATAPADLRRNGTYLVFRKLHQDVAGFRRYLRAHSATQADEELLAAKLVGRWRSGAPLALAPDQDDPELGADPSRNNDFRYRDADERGLRCPVGSHIRRMNPRDAVVTGEVRLHRMIRRGTSYGPPLPEGELADDGADRGLCFVFVGAHLDRQFEFVQTQWVSDGRAFGAPDEVDPLIGPNDGAGVLTIPARPIRRRLTDLPRFVTTRGGEYCFAPSLSGLRWLAELSD